MFSRFRVAVESLSCVVAYSFSPKVMQPRTRLSILLFRRISVYAEISIYAPPYAAVKWYRHIVMYSYSRIA